MIVKRIAAQLIDLFVGLLILFAVFAYILPFLSRFIKGDTVLAVIGIVLFVGLTAGVQYPFMKMQQTLGKGFFSLKIVSTDKERKDVPISVIVQREILCKLMSCFFICLPVLAGKAGGHEEATHTAVAVMERERT